VLLAIGESHFKDLLKGAQLMDEHFRTASLEKNMPVILALLGIWQRNYLKTQSQAILPYSFRLRRLAEYLQQLDMESNGKSIDIDGGSVHYQTGPIVWGGMGNNGQHAYYQLLHQGTHEVAIDFIVPCNQMTVGGNQHLAACSFAQALVLMQGRNGNDGNASTDDTTGRHRQISGNKASNTLLMESLSPRNLGALLALYEHKVFIQGICWKINSFDQWGIELGKQLSLRIESEIVENSGDILLDSSTAALVEKFKRNTS